MVANELWQNGRTSCGTTRCCAEQGHPLPARRPHRVGGGAPAAALERQPERRHVRRLPARQRGVGLPALVVAPAVADPVTDGVRPVGDPGRVGAGRCRSGRRRGWAGRGGRRRGGRRRWSSGRGGRGGRGRLGRGCSRLRMARGPPTRRCRRCSGPRPGSTTAPARCARCGRPAGRRCRWRSRSRAGRCSRVPTPWASCWPLTTRRRGGTRWRHTAPRVVGGQRVGLSAEGEGEVGRTGDRQDVVERDLGEAAGRDRGRDGQPYAVEVAPQAAAVVAGVPDRHRGQGPPGLLAHSGRRRGRVVELELRPGRDGDRRVVGQPELGVDRVVAVAQGEAADAARPR